MAGNPSYLALTSLKGQILETTQLAGTSATTVYTVPANSTVKIATATLCNSSAAAVAVTVNLVKSGGTAGVGNRIVSAYSLAAGNTFNLTEFLAGAMLAEGEFISVTAGAGAAITVALTGAVSV